MRIAHVLRMTPGQRRLLLALAAAAALLPAAGWAQVRESGRQGGASLSAGALASAGTLQYGDRKMLGFTAFVDADTHRRIGIEAEARWLEWRQYANVHAETYSVGPRYHLDIGRRFEPYAKGMIGKGHFNFPYNLAIGNYIVITAGGGLDMRLTRRIYWRAVDFEYQNWPQFTFGSMTNLNASSGIRVRIF